LGTFARLINVVKRLAHCSRSGNIRGGNAVRQSLLDAELYLLKIIAAIDEIVEGVAQLNELDPTVKFDGSSELQILRTRLSTLLKSVEGVNSQVRLSGTPVFTEGVSARHD
jgi:hypothetical protein